MSERPTFGSLFSGVGGIDLGLHRAGFDCRWQVEIDEYRRRVLERHFPGVPRYTDVRAVGGEHAARSEGAQSDRGNLRRDNLDAVDLIAGGFPCQDISIAGKRAGLAGARSGLFHEFARILGELCPTWLLVENVPGLLNSNEGRDFAVVLGTLGDLGYGVAWRVLDSRFFGVPQRRRRVFIVGHLGAPCPPEVLFESEGGAGDPETREASRAIAAGDLARSIGAVGGGNDYGANKGTLIASDDAPDAGGETRGREGSASVGGGEPDAREGERSGDVRTGERADRNDSTVDSDGMRAPTIFP